MIGNIFDDSLSIDASPTESDRDLAKESHKIIKCFLSESGSCQIKILVNGIEKEAQVPMMAMRLLAEALEQIAIGKGGATGIISTSGRVSNGCSEGRSASPGPRNCTMQ
jgi:hypothetical protein